MRNAIINILLLSTCLLVPNSFAQDAAGGSKSDSDAIKKVFADFYGNFSKQDAHGTAMTFAEDGDFTNMFGIHIHGRPDIEKRFTALFKGNLRGTTRTDTVRNIRFYAPNVAFVDADTVITGTKRDDGSVGPVRPLSARWRRRRRPTRTMCACCARRPS